MSDVYAIYLRKSRADMELESIDKMDTLKRHEAILKELAKRKGFQIGGIYKEIVSGENIASRPEMKRLLSDVHKNKYKGVLVVEVERLARGDTRDQATVSEAFKYTNTLIITPSKTYDPNNQYDEEYFEFGLFMSRREYKTIQRRLKTGKLQSVKEGNYLCSSRPYGYDKVRKGKTRSLVINEEEAKFIRMIFDWRVNEKITAGKIAIRLTKMGVKTYTGVPEWTRTSVVEILQNPVYAGKVRWNYRKVTRSFEDGNLRLTRPRNLDENDVIMADGKHKPLVSWEMFEAAQKDFKSDKSKTNTKLTNVFAGLLRCAKCGKTFVYVGMGHRKDNVQPRLAHPYYQNCKVKSVIFTDLQDAVIQALLLHKQEFEIKLSNTNEREHLERHEAMIDAVTKEIEGLKKQRAKLFDLFERNVYDEDDFIERKNILDERKKTAENQLLELQSTKPEPVDYEEKVIKLSDAIEALRDPIASAKTKNTLLKEIIDHIDFSREDNDSFAIDIFLR